MAIHESSDLPQGASIHLEYLMQHKPHTMPSMHVHTHYELFYLMGGERTYFLNDRTFSLKGGDIILIPPDVLHKTVSHGSSFYERTLISFEGSFIEDLVKIHPALDPKEIFKTELLQVKAEDKTLIEMLIFKMLQEQDSDKETSQIQLQLLLAELLLILKDMQSGILALPVSYPNEMHEKISEIIQYINSHYMDPLSLELIEERFYMSRYHFCRNFKAITGMTFTEYLNVIRVQEAQKLLRNTSLPVHEIALKSGFETQSHFSRVFKSQSQMTALRYRHSALHLR